MTGAVTSPSTVFRTVFGGFFMIRIATEKDIPQILAIYGPYVEDTTVSFEYTVPSEEAFLERFRGITAQFPWLVWEEEGKVLGYAYGSPPYARAAYGWCAEPSIYLRPRARGRGIGRKLYTALETLLEEQGYQVSLALITGENGASAAFHEKLGYALCGRLHRCGFKLGKWLDVVWMEKRLNTVHNPECFPTPWEHFRQDEQKIYDILANLSLS